MGTYTTNYQLYTPTVGEQGWGTLVNGNFTTIDTTMAGLNARLTAVENEVNGALSCTSVATSGTITSTGLITANGGIKGNLTGNVTGNCFGRIYVNAKLATSGEVQYATCAAQNYSVTLNNSTGGSTAYYDGYMSVLTCNGYTNKSITYPVKMGAGAYVYSASYIKSGSVPTSVSRTVTLTVKETKNSSSGATSYGKICVNGSVVTSSASLNPGETATVTTTVTNGNTVGFYVQQGKYTNLTVTLTISALSTYYIQAT